MKLENDFEMENVKEGKIKAEVEWVFRQYARHVKNGYKWLDQEAVYSYQEKFEASDRSAYTQRSMANELMKVYGVTDIEAINILNGKNAGDYLRKYEMIRTKTPVGQK